MPSERQTESAGDGEPGPARTPGGTDANFLVDGKYAIRDLVDIEALRQVFEKFSAATGFTIGFLAYPSLEILIATGWRDVCTRFHRACHDSSQHCKASNAYLMSRITQTRELSICPCENGLVDGAIPIVIRGRTIAALATGQILFAPPDEKRFRRQAVQYGYDPEAYMDALSKVPVVSEARFRKAGDFLSEIAVMIAELGLSNLQIRERTEELAAEKERLAVTLRSIGDGVIATDAKGRISLVNRMAEALTGWPQEEALGRPLEDVFHTIDETTREACENPVAQVLRTASTVSLRKHPLLIARDGAERVVAETGAPIHARQGEVVGVVLVFRDITEVRQAEEELQKSQKLESLGLLAGGIAHDFNNILTGILGNASASRLWGPLRPEIEQLIGEVEKASLRARDLTQQLLTFSRGGAPVKKPTSLREIIMDSAGFALHGSSSRCRFLVPDDLWYADVYPGQISQVIQNLVLNADQAMAGGGTVPVEARNLTAQEVKGLPLKPDRHVEISVADTGIGIPDSHLGRIFDPYFTTKQKGRGLGLFTTFSIVRNHDGHIAVESQVGRGTTVRVFLPAGDQPAAADAAAPAAADALQGRRLLLMDDEEMIRTLASVVFRRIGCDVTVVEDGAAALRSYREALASGKPFDAVILDLTVPGGMGGLETLGNIRKIDPAARVLASSGYSTDPVLSECLQAGFAGMVPKPYRQEDLIETLARLLSSPRT